MNRICRLIFTAASSLVHHMTPGTHHMPLYESIGAALVDPWVTSRGNPLIPGS